MRLPAYLSALCLTFMDLLNFAQQAPEVLPGCAFPSFLRHPMPDDRPRFWVTEMRYEGHRLQRQTELTVSETEIVAKVAFAEHCDPGRQPVDCMRREIVYHQSCHSRTDGKYKIMHRSQSGRILYSCLKFVRRNRNVLQVWEGTHHDNEEHASCDESQLQRSESLWMTPVIETWSRCPVNGGFDFETLDPISKQKLCPSEWRSARLESECVLGEGLRISFPAADCSPFPGGSAALNLTCWADWVEGEHHYVITGLQEQPPRFAFRFPAQARRNRKFKAHVYLAPICPASRRGDPVRDSMINYYELEMKQGGKGMCYDESESCQTFLEEGKCSNSAIYQYANYCKLSCKLCGLLPSPTNECHFPAEIQGDWRLYEANRREEVTIRRGTLTFSELGTFICKGKHYAKSHYKLLSSYSNGCRPRYTCMNIVEGAERVLLYQIAGSTQTDQSFANCNFQDDPPPLGGSVRSAQLKTMLPARKTTADTCGLEGSLDVYTPDDVRGGSCHGTLSDWNSGACGRQAVLNVTLNGNCKAANERTLLFEEEYLCIAYITLEEDYSLLITKDGRGRDKYACWVIKTYAERMSHRPWREIYMLNRAQCGQEADLDPIVLSKASLVLRAKTERVSRPCDQDFGIPNKGGNPGDSWYQGNQIPTQNGAPSSVNNQKQTGRHDDSAAAVVDASRLYALLTCALLTFRFFGGG